MSSTPSVETGHVQAGAGATVPISVPLNAQPRLSAAPSRAGRPRSRQGLQISRGRIGDHPAALQFLNSIFHAPSAAEFCARSDEPSYTARDRMLIKDGEQILSHVLLVRRQMRFGRALIPTVRLEHLATLPEYRSRGFASALLDAVERRMLTERQTLAITRTTSPHFFRRHGWITCDRLSRSKATCRDILAQLEMDRADRAEPLPGRKPRRPQLSVRLWRQVEQGALTRLYARNTEHRFGPPARTFDYWRWLISRGAFDRLYVAVEGPDHRELDDVNPEIVGYAVANEGRIVELMASPECPEAAPELLARVCGDAIEREQTTVRLDAPADDPLHRTLRAAAGRAGKRGRAQAAPGIPTRASHATCASPCPESNAGQPVLMAKLLDPIRFLIDAAGELQGRGQAAGLNGGYDLGLRLGRKKFRLDVTPDGVRVQSGRLGRSYLAGGAPELTQVLLGHCSATESIGAGRIEASTRVAAELGDVLLPRLPFWHPPWDDEPAA